MFVLITEVWHRVFDYPSDTSVQDLLVEPPDYSQDVIVKKLVHYHRHISGIVQAYHCAYKTVNADQPKSDVVSQG